MEQTPHPLPASVPAPPTDALPGNAPGEPVVWPPPSIGWLEVALPLWSRRWRLLFSAFALAALLFAVSLHRPLLFVGKSSFVVTAVQRPSGSVGGGPVPGVTVVNPGGASAIDLHVAMLRSRLIGDRLIDRFDLVRAWEVSDASVARALLAKRLDFTISRREGVVYVEAIDYHPQRAAAIANQAIDELKLVLRGLALDEARQRRSFYEQQLQRAREGLEQAQQRLRGSGFDRAALRSEPGAAATAYARQQAEVTAAEVRLAALRRVRADSSPEVEMARAEISTLRAQLSRLEAPRDEGNGSFGLRLRELRYAEQLVETLSRQAEAARFDEDADPVPVQVLDRARPEVTPASPNPVLWALGGLILGFGLQAVWILLRHRTLLAQREPGYQQRLAQVVAVLPPRRQGFLARLRARRRSPASQS